MTSNKCFLFKEIGWRLNNLTNWLGVDNPLSALNLQSPLVLWSLRRMTSYSPSALLPPNSKVCLEQVADLKLDCCKAHSQAFEVKTLIFATINCSHHVNGKAGLWRVVSEWLVWLPSTGWHPNAEPNAFWAQWTVLGWWGTLVLVLRWLSVVVC